MSIFISIDQNIPPSIFLSKFQKFSPVSKTRKKKVGNYNSLLTHFICRVIMILSIPVSETMGTGMGTMTWVWVRVLVLHVKSHRYGSETRSVSTGTNFRIRISFTTMGMGKLSPLQLQLKNLATSLSMKEGFNLQNQLSVTSNTGTPVVHTK